MLGSQVSDISHEVGLVDTIRNLGHHNLVVLLAGLNLGLGTHHDTATTSLVSILHTLQSIDIGTCREVGTGDILHQALAVDFRIIDKGAATVNHLTQVMGRHIRSHTYGNTVTTVYQQVGHLGRHHAGLQQGIIEVGVHIHGILLQVVHDVLTHLREAALRVTHGSR